MNLYQIEMKHYAPKDSAKGIVGFLVAKDDEEVYEWMKNDLRDEHNEIYVYTTYEDNEQDKITYDIYDDEYNVIGKEDFKAKMIRLKGDLNDDEVELDDLYYGKTLYGWKLIKENTPAEALQMARNLGIPIYIADSVEGNADEN